MNIKNVSNRIINIGATILRPDDTMPVTDQVLGTPAIKALIDKGWLSADESPKTPGSGAKNSRGSVKGKNGRKPGGASEPGYGKNQEVKDDSSASSDQKDPSSGEVQ